MIGSDLSDFCIAPKVFNIIKFSSLFLENMNNYMDIVHQNPRSLLDPFNMPRLVLQVFRNCSLNRAQNRSYLCVGITFTDDKIIAGGIIYLSQIYYGDVLSFNIFYSFNNQS